MMGSANAWQWSFLLSSCELLALRAWPGKDCPARSTSSLCILLASFVVTEKEGKTQPEK